MKGLRSIELVGVYASWWARVLSFFGRPRWLVVELRFTVGALTDFQEYVEGLEGDLTLDQALRSMTHLRVLLSLLSKYAGREVPEDRFKFLAFSQIEDIVALIEEAVEGLGNLYGVKAAPETHSKPASGDSA